MGYLWFLAGNDHVEYAQTRTVHVELLSSVNMAAASSSSTVRTPSNNSNPVPLYKLKITLHDYETRWRRVIVPANFSLLELHIVIQLVFGWENYHLHQYDGRRMGKTARFKAKRPDDRLYGFKHYKEERIYRLCDVFDEENKSLNYEYDFGAGWEHGIKFEGIWENNTDGEYPMCIKGKGANRLEDCKDLDEDEMLLPEYDGKEFDLEEAQGALRKVFAGKWPSNVDNRTVQKCYVCAYYRCPAVSCDGKCCSICLKAEMLSESACSGKRRRLIGDSSTLQNI